MIDHLNGKAINTLNEQKNSLKTGPWHEIIIKRDGKVIYHNRAFAGILSIVHSVDKFSQKEIEGDSQSYLFGPAPFALFAYDQFRHKVDSSLQFCASVLSHMAGMKPSKFRAKRREIFQSIKDHDSKK